MTNEKKPWYQKRIAKPEDPDVDEAKALVRQAFALLDSGTRTAPGHDDAVDGWLRRARAAGFGDR